MAAYLNNFVKCDTSFDIRHFSPAVYVSPIDHGTFIRNEDRLLLDPSVVQSTDANGSSRSSLTEVSTPSEPPQPASSSTAHYDPKSATATYHMTDAIPLERAGPRSKLFFNPQTVVPGIVTCGGLCPALNNVIRAVVNCLIYRYHVKRVLGFKYGFQGLDPASTQVVELHGAEVRDIHKFGGSILGTSRGPHPPDGMVEMLLFHKIDILFCIGGDGTQRGAQAIAAALEKRNLKISIIGIPKSIDNDLAYVDRTFGFQTAVELAQSPINAGHEEARSVSNGISIVKLMGRESGLLALHAALASQDVNLLLIPEVKFTIAAVVEYLKFRLPARDHVLIVVAEGAGQDLLPPSGQKDASGNIVFGDIGLFLKQEIAREMKNAGITTTIRYIDPSYTIRSGVSNADDAAFAVMLGCAAAHAGMAGKTEMMVSLLNNTLVHVPLKKAIQFKKRVDVNGLAYKTLLDATGMPRDMVTFDGHIEKASPATSPGPKIKEKL